MIQRPNSWRDNPVAWALLVLHTPGRVRHWTRWRKRGQRRAANTQGHHAGLPSNWGYVVRQGCPELTSVIVQICSGICVELPSLSDATVSCAPAVAPSPRFTFASSPPVSSVVRVLVSQTTSLNMMR